MRCDGIADPDADHGLNGGESRCGVSVYRDPVDRGRRKGDDGAGVDSGRKIHMSKRESFLTQDAESRLPRGISCQRSARLTQGRRQRCCRCRRNAAESQGQGKRIGAAAPGGRYAGIGRNCGADVGHALHRGSVAAGDHGIDARKVGVHKSGEVGRDHCGSEGAFGSLLFFQSNIDYLVHEAHRIVQLLPVPQGRRDVHGDNCVAGKLLAAGFHRNVGEQSAVHKEHGVNFYG